MQGGRRLTQPVLTFLMSVITVLIFIFFYLFYAYHQFVMETIVAEARDRVEKNNIRLLKRINEFYYIVGEYIHTNPQIISAFKNNDRKALLNASFPLFNLLKGRDPELEIMHFHTRDNRSFLRLHRPEDFNDSLVRDRDTIAHINTTGKPMSAIEIGKYGIGYRVGIPIYDGLTMLGVLEFGLRLGIFSNSLLNHTGVDSAILIRKDKLKLFLEHNPTHELWKSRSIIASDGEEYLIYKTCGNLALSEEDLAKLARGYFYKESENGDHHIVFKGDELRDIHGEGIGFLIIDKKINYYMGHAMKFEAFSLFFGILLWFVVLGLFYLGYRRYSAKLRFYEDKLLEKNKALEHRTLHDHLTEVANRRNIENLIQEAINEREDGGFSLAIFDIDNFKHINDTYGHSTGDTVLKKLAMLAKVIIGEKGVVGRWGGEEFILWFPNNGAQEAFAVAEHLRLMAQEYIFDEGFKVTCSFGISEFHAGMNLDSFLRSADEAMYQAKNSGKNRVILVKHDQAALS